MYLTGNPVYIEKLLTVITDNSEIYKARRQCECVVQGNIGR